MANFKLNKIQHGQLVTATSAGTLTLVNNSLQYQIFTGTSTHTLVLPDATTMGSGLNFIVVNNSTGSITVQNNGASTLATITGGSTAEFILSDNSTSNGVWRTYTAGLSGVGGVASVTPGSNITSNYTVVSGDSGRVLNVDTSAGAIQITLLAPTAGFDITIKDIAGNASVNNITILRNSASDLIDGEINNDILVSDYASISYASSASAWYRVSNFKASNVNIAVFGGGETGVSSNVLDYVSIDTLANAVDFGDLTVARYYNGSYSSKTRGIWAGGYTGSNSDVIDYITITTTGNATSFGNLTNFTRGAAGCSSSTRGITSGGQEGSGPGGLETNKIEYTTIATTGNGTSFGTLTSNRTYNASCSSSTRGISAGGSSTSTIDYITIATTGNATSFGNLSAQCYNGTACSNSTRGVILLGSGGAGAMEYITIATTGNSTSFGNLSVTRTNPGAAASSSRGLFAGGYAPALTNVIDYININTTGNAVDFGDLTVARGTLSGISNCHGGL